MFKQLVPITLRISEATDYSKAKKICEYLAHRFEIKMQVISGCFKFVESDIFLYVEKLSKIYLVFIVSEEEGRE